MLFIHETPTISGCPGSSRIAARPPVRHHRANLARRSRNAGNLPTCRPATLKKPVTTVLPLGDLLPPARMPSPTQGTNPMHMDKTAISRDATELSSRLHSHP